MQFVIEPERLLVSSWIFFVVNYLRREELQKLKFSCKDYSAFLNITQKPNVWKVNCDNSKDRCQERMKQYNFTETVVSM